MKNLKKIRNEINETARQILGHTSNDNTKRDPFRPVKVNHARGRIGKFIGKKRGFEEGDEIPWEEVEWGKWSYGSGVRLGDALNDLYSFNNHEGKAIEQIMENLSDAEIECLLVDNPNPEEERGIFIDHFFFCALAVQYGFKIDEWDSYLAAEEGRKRIEAGERERLRRKTIAERTGEKIGDSASRNSDLDKLKEWVQLIDEEYEKTKQRRKANEEAWPAPENKIQEQKVAARNKGGRPANDPDGKVRAKIQELKDAGGIQSEMCNAPEVIKLLREGKISCRYSKTVLKKMSNDEYKENIGVPRSAINDIARKIYNP